MLFGKSTHMTMLNHNLRLASKTASNNLRIIPHRGISSMPFWSKSEDPINILKCAINV